ncbi:alpha/beta hydrolase [Sphingomonas paeninsulae]|uniref:Alpha/beta hydrolase n=1 Tax=Sphingomonas paeninsulae TaxID=2319844 RepID=A0A494TKM2_SPHPE|nr:alpha/beta hydrolase [Sphingomonas paeninsulae]AYJ88084.1 alpha/beta hydrolase [Sphingomonas paeninsulae]
MAVASLLSACSPPGMLNALDRGYGSSGAGRVASAVAFGTHGQTLDVWRPVDNVTTLRPVVIFWYGGGWVNGTRQDYGFAARAFASKGFVVVVPDYRKVPDIHFPAMLQDGAEAVRWTRDNVAKFGGDPARIAFAGHSAGAYTVAMLTLDRRWLKAEGVDPRIVKAAVGLCGPYDFYPFTGRAIEAMSLWPRPMETQPINFVRPDAPPMLLVTATKDTQVRPRNAINLAAALKKVGAPVVLRDYQGLTHEQVVMALSRPFRGKGPVLADSVAFIQGALSRSVSPEPAK